MPARQRLDIYIFPRYFPKDSPSDGLGHRHDWEGVIIYLSSATLVIGQQDVTKREYKHYFEVR